VADFDVFIGWKIVEQDLPSPEALPDADLTDCELFAA
jgi:hypothetical protein